MTKNKDDLAQEMKDLGYKLLDYYHVENNAIKVIVKDKIGYKYDVFLFNIRTHPPKIISSSNPNSVFNLKIWLKVENKSFTIKSIPEEINNTTRILFYCKKCKNDFYSYWNSLSSGNGCSVCSKKKAGKRNNLEYFRKDLLKDWDYESNTLLPNEVTEFSNQPVFWKCHICEYKWKCPVSYRTSSGNGCASCSGRVVTDRNRLSILHPEISSQWHPTKNGNLTPYDVSYGSNMKVWWLCNKGHSWQAAICDRIGRESGCGRCSSSKGEEKLSKILFHLGMVFESEKRFSDCRYKNTLPFDFYLPSYNLCIEYHGPQHYNPVDFAGRGVEWAKEEFKKNKKRDKIKVKYCKDNNIPLLIIPYWDFDNIEIILEQTLFN